jgi:hypothetical protein
VPQPTLNDLGGICRLVYLCVMNIQSRIDASGMRCTAHFSDDELYRYYLEWSWTDGPLITICMLNPSTATHEVLDPTIRGLIKRANIWGYGGVAVVNLFAFRSKSPVVMKAAMDPVGPRNDETLLKVTSGLTETNLIVGAWGNHGQFRNRDQEVLKIIGKKLHVFGLNANGTPKHPLYVSHSCQLNQWPQS